MSDARFTDWLQEKTALPGLIGIGIYAPGKPTMMQACASGVSELALENAWRCAAETIPVLQFNGFPTGGFRFVFAQAFVHCERRPDGTCIGICALKNDKIFSPAQLETLLAEFHAL
jgi:hypothetical protein